jgi:hypothetical protein
MEKKSEDKDFAVTSREKLQHPERRHNRPCQGDCNIELGLNIKIISQMTRKIGWG